MRVTVLENGTGFNPPRYVYSQQTYVIEITRKHEVVVMSIYDAATILFDLFMGLVIKVVAGVLYMIGYFVWQGDYQSACAVLLLALLVAGGVFTAISDLCDLDDEWA